MRPRDGAADGKAQSVPVPLGGKERLLHARQQIGRNALARVADLDGEHLAGGMGADRQRAAIRHRVARVGRQVEQQLFQVGLATGEQRHRVGEVESDLDGVGAQGFRQNRQRALDRARQIAFAARVHAAASKREHAAEDAPAGLDRRFDLFQVVPQHGRIELTGTHLGDHLLHQRQHRAEGVVDVVRDAAGEVGQRVLALRLEHAQLERFGALQVLDRHRRLRQKPTHEFRLVATQSARVARRDANHAHEPLPRGQRRAEHGARARFVRVEVQHVGERLKTAAVPLAPRTVGAVEAEHVARFEDRCQPAVERERFADAAALALAPGDLLRHQFERVGAFFVDEDAGRVVVERERAKAVEDLVEEILRAQLLHHLAVDARAHFRASDAIDVADQARDRLGDAPRGAHVGAV